MTSPLVAAASQPSIRTLASLEFKAVASGKEALAWVKHALNHLWPEFDRVAQFFLHHHVLPMLKVKLPDKIKDVKCLHFTLGTTPPELNGIMVTNLPRGTCRVQCEMEYISDLVVRLGLETWNAMSIHCGIQNFKIVGKIVLTLSMYVEAPSVKMYVTMSFMDTPEIDFRFVGNSALLNQLGIRSIILNSISEFLNKTCVMPRMVATRINLRTFEVYPLRLDCSEPLGILRVKLLHCLVKPQRGSAMVNLRQTVFDALEAIDNSIGYIMRKDVSEYLVFKVGSSVWQPKAKESGAFHVFDVVDIQQRLVVELWDRDVTSSDDLLGTVDRCMIRDLQFISGRVPIYSVTGKEAGEVEFETSFSFIKPHRVGVRDNLLIMHIGELRHSGSGWEGSRFVVQVKIGKEVHTTEELVPSDAWYKDSRVERAVAEVREKLEKANLDPMVIEKALQLEGDGEVVPVHANCVFCSIPTDSIATAVVEISILKLANHIDKRGRQVVKRRFSKNSLLAEATLKLAEIGLSDDLTWHGPITMRTGDGDEIVVEMRATLYGLVPDEIITDDGEV